MHVKIKYIYKDKAQVILFKKVIPHTIACVMLSLIIAFIVIIITF